jgi:asparagine synthase (glutamine-hydrolysing)
MMAGIAGIAGAKKGKLVERMLDKMTHRGRAWRNILEEKETTLGLIGFKIQEHALFEMKKDGFAQDGFGPGRFAQVQANSRGFILKRDPIGIAPLYYGWTNEGEFCFASEVKGLLAVTRDVHELPPGFNFDGQNLEPYYQLSIQPILNDPPAQIAAELRRRLEVSVEKSIGDGNVGAWLSGGLDSSTMAALARRHVDRLHTFAVGLPGAPDLDFARQMAEAIRSEHHEVIVKPDEILAVLPEVIYYLESFDALLVRSSILNYIVARQASHFVPAVFSGEGGDELFAGYDYLKALNPDDLPAELIDITGRLHNTALQRVDRCASAHGTVPHVGFLDPDVLEYAFRIPSEYKLRDGVEKWILRQAVADLLPAPVLNRPKSKFWLGGGVEDLLARYAEKQISMADFERERELPNGGRLNTREELLYYRIFTKHFGEFLDLSWMGRTKGAPIA